MPCAKDHLLIGTGVWPIPISNYVTAIEENQYMQEKSEHNNGTSERETEKDVAITTGDEIRSVLIEQQGRISKEIDRDINRNNTDATA